MSEDKKILVSGGWGYGNLGDDAILHSTILLVKKRFPGAVIKVMSYNPEETAAELNFEYEVLPSVHRLLFGESAFKQLNIYGKSRDNRRLSVRILNRIKRYFPKKELVPDMEAVKAIYHDFENVDIFIMSGGGYFNNWRESAISRCEELKIAHKFGVDSYIVGQTLDAFDEHLYDLVKTRIQNCKGIAVRDNDSQAEIESMGMHALITPDLVLSMSDDKPKLSNNEFVFIPAELPFYDEVSIVDGVALFAEKHKIPVTVALTRLYHSDVRCARRVVKRLRKKGVEVKFTIPKSYSDIASTIVGANFIFSRNLHGLILGYIGGGKVLSLNDQWKFKGFLKQIEGEPLLVSNEEMKSPNLIADKLEYAYNFDISNNTRIKLKNEVVAGFNNLFDDK